MRTFCTYIYNNFLHYIKKAVSLRATAALLALVMLTNITGECAAQVFTLEKTPYKQFQTAVADNTRVVKNVSATLNTAYAQNQNTGLLTEQQVKAEVDAAFKGLNVPAELHKAIYNQYLQDVAAQDKEVAAIYNKAKQDYHPEDYLNEAYKQGASYAAKHGGSFEGAKVCEGKVCYDYANYTQGVLRALLAAGRGDGSSKQYRWNREIMLDYMPKIYDAIEMGGIHRADNAAVQTYARFLLAKADDYCDNDTYLVDWMPGLGYSLNGKSNGRKSDAEQGKARRQKECEAIGKALLTLGIATETGADRTKNAEIIYNVMKDTYKDDYGAITAVNGTAALIAVGSVGSYKYIDRFLTVDTLKEATDFGTVWNGCKWVLGLLSIQQWVEMATTANNKLRGRGGRYLNQLGAVYQYIDEDEARKQGLGDFTISVMKSNPSLAYNVPYGNVLEDLGAMVAGSGTKQGQAIAQRILSIYVSNVKAYGSAMNYVHTPLVAGVLSTGIIKSSEATFAAQKINSLDWWDLNEATQRRVNNIAGKYSGTTVRSKDEAKVKRNENNQKIISAAVWADVVVTAVFMAMLIKSIPSIVRSIGTFSSNLVRIRAINVAGKGNLLKIMRARVKAAPLKPIEVRAKLQQSRVAAAEERAAASRVAAKKNLAAQEQALAKKVQKVASRERYKLVEAKGQQYKVTKGGNIQKISNSVKEPKASTVEAVGEGGSAGGASTSKATAAEQAAWEQRAAQEEQATAARIEAQAQEFIKEAEYAKANAKPFKGNWIFNKPYNQLGTLRKWAFDTYYWKINPAFKLSGDITTQLVKNPMKTTMMGSLPFGTTAEMAQLRNTVGIYTTVSQQAGSGFELVKNIDNGLSFANQTVKTTSGLANSGKTLALPMSLGQKAMAMGGFMSLPTIIGVLNEFHGGNSGGMGIKPGSSNFYSAPVKAEEKTPVTPTEIQDITPVKKPLTPIKSLVENNWTSAAAAAAVLPLMTPKYVTTQSAQDVEKGNHFISSSGVHYSLQTAQEAAEQSKAIARQNAEKLKGSVNVTQGRAPLVSPVLAVVQSDPVLAAVLFYAIFRKSLTLKSSFASKKTYRDNTNPANGFFGANIKLPKGYDKKKGVLTYYLNEAGEEVALPLTFNIDKAIKITNSQRGVFTQEGILEIRNGAKKPQHIEGFCMLAENTAKAKKSLIRAIKEASLPKAFQLKLQFSNAKVSKHLKEVPFISADGKGAPYIKLMAPRNMVKDGETVVLSKDGTISAINKYGETRTLPDFTFRVPKSEIPNLIKVLQHSNEDFVLDIVPTQNKNVPFILTFLASISIMAAAPAFKEMFQMTEFWANTIIGFISFGPALSIPLFGGLFKKYGVTNVMKKAAIASAIAIALMVGAGFYGYHGSSNSTLGLVLAATGLFILSLSNEIKFSSMSPVIETNFDNSKALSLTTKALMARSIGTIAMLQLPYVVNKVSSLLGLPKADDTVAFALFLLPVALSAAAKMMSTKLREVPDLPENDISVKNLIKIFKENKEIRNGAFAFTMFESFEATMALMVFSLAKQHYGELSSAPGIIGGVAIYAAMVLGRYIASSLQKKGILDGQKTLITTFAALGLGSAMFATFGISLPGLIGAAIAFMGASNTFAPLYNVTSKRNPNKSSEISLIFFTTTTLATLSTLLLGAVIDATGSVSAGFVVPILTILGALYFGKYAFKNLNLRKKAGKKGTQQAAPAVRTEYDNPPFVEGEHGLKYPQQKEAPAQ